MHQAVWIRWAAGADGDRERLHDEKNSAVPIIMAWTEILGNSGGGEVYIKKTNKTTIHIYYNLIHHSTSIHLPYPLFHPTQPRQAGADPSQHLQSCGVVFDRNITQMFLFVCLFVFTANNNGTSFVIT